MLHDHEVAQQLAEPDREKAALSFIDALVELHAADVDEIGLGDLAKRDEYIARQLKRWYAQYEHSRTSDDQTVERAHALLSARIPDAARVDGRARRLPDGQLHRQRAG